MAAGAREVRGLPCRCGLERDASRATRSARARASFFRGVPGGGELGGRVCRERGGGEASHFRSRLVSVHSAPLLEAQTWGTVMGVSRVHWRYGLGASLVLTKGASLHPAGRGSSGREVFSKQLLALGRSASFLDRHFITVIAILFLKDWRLMYEGPTEAEERW